MDALSGQRWKKALTVLFAVLAAVRFFDFSRTHDAPDLLAAIGLSLLAVSSGLELAAISRGNTSGTSTRTTLPRYLGYAGGALVVVAIISRVIR
ncbi:hypothetical protein ACFFGH_33130 [Lysobacter korlensis]|uniref:Transmembrane protein n=1 Tax=Lysobacter korlensis TaxID=553636 RepID=A0ABV6S0E7_9GAMM